MPLKTYSASQIANYFLANIDPTENDISNLKLQKLCYYAQGLITAMRGVKLFEDKIFAWDHGPVVVNLYHLYKSHGAAPIPPVFGSMVPEIDPIDRPVLNDIFNYYGRFSAWHLRNMTHEESPWLDAYNDGQREIKVKDMVAFFRPNINEEYIEKHYGEKLP